MGVRVGLTGGVASGKSTVSARLAELGAVVIDADVLARQVVAPGTEGLEEIVAEFGEDLLTPEGELDRARLAALVFHDESSRRALEAIVHPRVRAAGGQLERAAPEDAVVVHDIPLLVETGQAGAFDAVVVVDVPVETQLERMVRDRGATPEEARARIAAQAGREERLAKATHVVDNAGSPAELRTAVTELYAELERMAVAREERAAGSASGDGGS